jgi:riboflavin synthase
MFTGIIERSVRVVAVADSPKFRRLTIASHWGDVRLGESIAVNGVCLTVAELGDGVIGFDVITETLSKTNLGALQAGDGVHVERALRVGDRLDGHFVQGHVDGVGRLVKQITTEGETRLSIHSPRELAKFLVPKGSVCIDGVSLTLAAISGETFEVALIPTTLAITSLARHDAGWLYNLEMDVLTKTVVTHLERFSGARA